MQLLARQQEELRAAQQRAVQLENDNVQLQARVSGEEGWRVGGAAAVAAPHTCTVISCLQVGAC